MLINSNPAQLRAQQLLAMHETRHAPRRLLLDGALNPAILKLVRSSGMPWFSVFAQGQAGDATLLKASPLLVECADLALLASVLDACNGLPMISAWSTPERLDEQGKRLHPWCVVKADGQYFNLRFPDTRRLPDIISVLTALQKDQLFGPATRCCYLGRDGTWQTLHYHGSTTPPADQVEFDEAQTLALMRAAEADETLSLLRRQSTLPDETPHTLYQRLDEALLAADRNGEQDPAARLALCQQAVFVASA